ncbi:MAG: aminotransferase class I/II-fold pyridoxal phosphate-dependent enzyme [Sedimenticola sp.]
MSNNDRPRRIPLYPTFSRGAASVSIRRGRHSWPGVLDTGKVQWTLNARSALQIGFQVMDLRPGDEVLVPAYHCPVMIYPIVEAGLQPVYFRIKEDCTVDLDDLKAKLTERTRAVVVIHYFGFPTPMQELRTLCNLRDLYLVEDCAHAFFGAWKSQKIGVLGDVTIASLYKFFPVYDGGAIRFGNRALLNRVGRHPHARLFFQLKSMLNTLEVRSNPNDPGGGIRFFLQLKDWLWGMIKKQPVQPVRQVGVSSESSSDSPFTPDIIAGTYSTRRMPLFSSLVYRFTSRRELVRRRRENYTYLLGKLEGLGLKPLFSELPEGVVPYNLALVSEQASGLADLLRSHGVSIARFGEYYWDEGDRGSCEVANRYSRNCFQIPIHQSLTREDMDYIASILANR